VDGRNRARPRGDVLDRWIPPVDEQRLTVGNRIPGFDQQFRLQAVVIGAQERSVTR
jgi:hypothetical protein